MSKFKEIVDSVLKEERQVGLLEVYLNKWYSNELNIKSDTLVLEGETDNYYGTTTPPMINSYHSELEHYLDIDKEHDNISGFSLILDGDALSNNFKLKRSHGERYYIFPRGKNAEIDKLHDRHPSDEEIKKQRELKRVVITDAHRYIKKLIVGRVTETYKNKTISFIKDFMLHFDDVPVEAFNATGQRFIEYAKRELEKQKSQNK